MNNAKISTKKLNLYYGANHALKDVDMDITCLLYTSDNAKQRIDIMAAGTGSRTGALLSANLGVFQITAKNSGSGEYSYDGAFEDVYKRQGGTRTGEMIP